MRRPDLAGSLDTAEGAPAVCAEERVVARLEALGQAIVRVEERASVGADGEALVTHLGQREPPVQAMMARDGEVWMGTLGAANAEPQLVIATSRDLLRAALTGADGRYPLDPRSTMSFVVSTAELGLHTDRVPVADVNDVKAISSIVVSVTGNAAMLRARFIVNDSAIAGRLAMNMRPVVTALARRLVGDGRNPTDVSLEVEGGDMEAPVPGAK